MLAIMAAIAPVQAQSGAFGEVLSDRADEFGNVPKIRRVSKNGVKGVFGEIKADKEWTLVTIQKGVDEDEAPVWTWGDETRSLALAGTGRGGVKLSSRQDDKRKMHAVKNHIAHFDRQFHCYAVTHTAGSTDIALYVDGRKAGEDLHFGAKGFGGQLKFGALVKEFRYYDTAYGEATLLEMADANPPVPADLPAVKVKSGTVETNAVLQLGCDLPDHLVIGEENEKKLVAQGIRARLEAGNPRSIRLEKGGVLALGSEGLTLEMDEGLRVKGEPVVFDGGTLMTYEKAAASIRSPLPISLEDRTKIVTQGTLAIRTGLTGPGDLVKEGPGVLGLQFPCNEATGRLVVEKGTLVLGAEATWGGTVVLKPGATLKCPRPDSAIGRLENKGGKVVTEGGKQ